MRKTLLLIVALAIPFIYFCCESSSDMENMQQKSEKEKMIIDAKSFWAGLNCDLSFPKHQSGASTRSVHYTTLATPIWENAYIEQKGELEVVVVPMEGEDEIRSKATITTGNEKSYQFAKTFSRLVVYAHEGKTLAHVITYLPESEYAETHAKELSSLGVRIKDVNFNGIIIVSSPEGVMEQTLLATNGHITHNMVPEVTHKHEHTAACNHEHVEMPELSIYLYSAEYDAMTRSAYADGVEDSYCDRCGRAWDSCDCACWVCGDSPCSCQIFICDVCLKLPCQCFMDPDYCSYCNSSPCVCKKED